MMINAAKIPAIPFPMISKAIKKLVVIFYLLFNLHLFPVTITLQILCHQADDKSSCYNRCDLSGYIGSNGMH